MTEREVVMRYINFCKQGRIPRVLYNAATKDLLVYSVADPRASLEEEAEKKGYADISTYVWSYVQFGDILYRLYLTIFPSCISMSIQSGYCVTVCDTPFVAS